MRVRVVETLLGYILSCRAYMKYVRKWLLLERNSIICPEVAVNGQLSLDKRTFGSEWLKEKVIRKYLPEKSKYLGENCRKISKCFSN